MFVKMLKSKLHSATVTGAKVDYAGSIAIDADLLAAADILPYESVLVADLNNANRLETYAIPAPAGSGQIEILGAAAKLIKTDDRIIIFSFAWYPPDEAKKIKPKIIVLDQNNKIKQKD